MDVDEDEVADFLKHYGKPGMKWGHRTRTSRNFGKDSHAANKSFNKVAKNLNDGVKYIREGSKLGLTPKGKRIQTKGFNALDKAATLQKARVDFINSTMRNKYMNTKVSEISAFDKKIGKAYIDMLIQD